MRWRKRISDALADRRMLWLTAAVLLAAAGYYLGRGFYALTFSPDNFPIDLRLRWAEHRAYASQ